MAKRAGFALLGLGTLFLIVVSLSGCFLFGGGPGVSGYVFEATSGSALSNVSVTINDNTGDSYSSTTDSSGKWFVADPAQGTYSVSASGSGYYFTTPAYSVVYSKGSYPTADTIAGVPYSGWPAYHSFLFILTWNGSPSSLGFHLTIPKANYAPTSVPASGYPESPSWIPSNSTDVTVWQNGFGPDLTGGALGNRYDCYFYSGFTNPMTGLVAKSSVQGGGPITIDLDYSNPIATGWTVSPDATNLFPSSATQFAGVAELYIDGGSTSLSNLGHAVVYALDVQPSGSSITPDGAFLITQDQNGEAGTVLSTTTVSVMRINIFDSGFQLVPDFRAVIPGGVRAVGATGAEKPNVINLPRR